MAVSPTPDEHRTGAPVAHDPLRVFVLCPSYHGATLLSLLMNEHRDVVALGDTNPRIDRDTACACGRTVRTCDFWLRLYRELDAPIVRGGRSWFPKRPPFTRSVRANTLLSYVVSVAHFISGGRLPCLPAGSLARYRRAHMALARMATEEVGARVFVDGEKTIEKAMVLGCVGDGPTKIIHLVRDPRGYVLSASRNRARAGDGSNSGDPSRMATGWRRYHQKALLARRLLGAENSLTVRYEDLATTTAETTARIYDFIGVPQVDTRASGPSRAEMHTIGNRMLKAFDGSVELDERWRQELSAAEASEILRASGRFATELGYR